MRIRLRRLRRAPANDVKGGDSLGAVHTPDGHGGEVVIRSIATADWTKVSRPARLEFSVRPDGELTPTVVASWAPIGWAYKVGDHWYVCDDETLIVGEKCRAFVLIEGAEMLGLGS